jgi:hypothetical protein
MAHKTLEKMVEVAENKGLSKRQSWVVSYTTDINATMELVETYRFKHYGTLILKIINVNKNNNYKVLHVHTQSQSDTQAINSMLRHFGIGKTIKELQKNMVIDEILDNLSHKHDEAELTHIDDTFYHFNCYDVRSLNGEDIQYNQCIVKINKYTLEEEE